tara:strand:+ start:7023 stop:7937 length:915 start_codon:yes stop_codon:yes gene_type:complete
MTVALIDADIIAYRSIFLSGHTLDDDTDHDPIAVKTTVDHLIKEWMQKAKAGTSICCMSDPSHRYFRHDVYPEYKANRTGERPAALTTALDHIREKHRIAEYDGLEADDVMGVLAGSTTLSDPVVVSIDKDMMTIPGKMLNPSKMRRPLRISKAAADRQVFMQALMGDRTDNYPGVEGIGPVKAQRIIEQHGDARRCWGAVVEAFGDEAQAITMVRLSRILRAEDYNFDTGEIRLWHPIKPVWMKPTQHTTEKAELKPLTTSKPCLHQSSSTDTALETSSNTSAATKKKTQHRRKRTLKKRGGI